MADQDIEKFRKPWELEDHWQLRKAFIETYIEDFPMDKLLCMAQLFVNIETLGVKYGEDVMEEISSLGANIPYVQEYRAFKEKREDEKAEKKKTRKLEKSEAKRLGYNNSNSYDQSNHGYGGNRSNYGFGKNQGNQGNYGYNSNQSGGGYGYNGGGRSWSRGGGQRQDRQYPGNQQPYQSNYGYNSNYNQQYRQYDQYDQYNQGPSGSQPRSGSDNWRDNRNKPAPSQQSYGYNYNNLYREPSSNQRGRGGGGLGRGRGGSYAPPQDVYQRARRY